MGKKKTNDEDSSTGSCDENQTNNQDSLGPSCQHVRKSVDPTKLRNLIKKTSGIKKDACSECKKDGSISPDNDDIEIMEYDRSLWLCLKCGSQLCGRLKNKHALKHFETPRSDEHSLAINTTTLEVWCYKCNSEISSDSHKKLLECVEFIKKESNKKPQETEDIFKQMSPNLAMEKGQSSITELDKKMTESLPRVKGLTNLGNTCFFNAVLQCLAQTPYLLNVLKESIQPGENFTLNGGILKLKDENETSLPQINGVLKQGGPLITALATTLEELQNGGGVFTPIALLKQVTAKWPQFSGGGQHDSHELLRRLLESVRAEDLRRYHKCILHQLGYSTKTDPTIVEEEVKSKIKFYGDQAQDRILCPEQVFRGFLVSTLTCQDCYNTSSRHESFLDISLPVSVEKPQPPIRRKNSPEPSVPSVSKYKQKKEKDQARKAKRNSKNVKQNETNDDNGDVDSSKNMDSKSNSSAEQSDADVEDNLIDDTPKTINYASNETTNSFSNIEKSPVKSEKKDDTPENLNKDLSDENEVSELPAENVENLSSQNTVVELGISSDGCSHLKRMINQKDNLAENFEQNLNINEEDKAKKQKRKRLISHCDWSTTIAPRYQCEDGECSVQSCLNNFTAAELMTGNNKVGCDSCTKKINGENGKTINTNATKQFLISTPPAVLILHLKRFQVGPRCMFRKLAKTVSFPFVLDIAPFCASNVKILPNVKRHQKKLLYSLYGIVEHSGTMHGGHYVAYVKVRSQLSENDPRLDYLPKGSKTELDQIDEQRAKLEAKVDEEINDSDDSISASSTTSETKEEAAGSSDNQEIKPPPGKWYYVSDSRVSEVNEETVKNTQAYLLFYERIY